MNSSRIEAARKRLLELKKTVKELDDYRDRIVYAPLGATIVGPSDEDYARFSEYKDLEAKYQGGLADS